MKKFLLILCTILLMTGCGTSESETAAAAVTETAETTAESTDETDVNEMESPSEAEANGLRVLAPRGATALGLLGIMEEAGQVELVDGTDIVQAAFVTPDSQYDVIVAPTNLGGKLAAGEKTKYRMLGVLTWGNLYIVGRDDDALSKEGTIAAFGEGAVPGLVFERVYKDIVPEAVFYNSVSDAQAALIAGKADSALLAEPAATATIAKLKEQGQELKVIADVQKDFAGESDRVGYPQAAVYVIEEQYNNNRETYDSFIESLTGYIDSINTSESGALDRLKEDVNKITPEELGVPNAEIAAKTWSGMNINYAPAVEVVDELNTFLELFGISADNAVIK